MKSDENSPRKRPASRRLIGRLALAVLLLIGSVTAAPELLAWPHSAQRGNLQVYSELPLPAEHEMVLARADGLVRQSPLYDPALQQRLFLTDGGWRWNLLALTSRHTIALRRPFRSAIIFNRSDIARDRIVLSDNIAGTRTLSGVIAHEMTHALVARRYGELTAAMLPTWKSEGYADFVAQESRLSDGQAQRLRESGTPHPALVYWEGRRRVAAALQANGGDVDALMRGERGVGE